METNNEMNEWMANETRWKTFSEICSQVYPKMLIKSICYAYVVYIESNTQRRCVPFRRSHTHHYYYYYYYYNHFKIRCVNAKKDKIIEGIWCYEQLLNYCDCFVSLPSKWNTIWSASSWSLSVIQKYRTSLERVRKRNRKFYMQIMVFGDNQCSNSPVFQWSTMS